MPTLALSTTINADPARVWDLICDIRGAPRVQPVITRIQMLTDTPFGVGTRWRETRRMFNREATETLEVVECTPGRSYTVAAFSCGAQMRSQFRVTPDAGATRLELDLTASPVSPFAKLMSIFTPLMMGPMKKALRSDLDAIKRAAEAATA